MGVMGMFSDTSGTAQPTDLFSELGQDIETSSEAIKASELVYPNAGDMFGHITVKGTAVDADVYYGDGSRQLNRGAGIYTGGGIPGGSGTILMAGHCNTYFHDLGSAAPGDKIVLKTHYGAYEYEVTGAKVADYQDTSTYDFSRGDENLILYTCYPFDSLGFTPERYFVYAKYVSGPMIDKTQ